MLAAPVVIFCKAYVEALGRRAGEETAEMVKRVVRETTDRAKRVHRYRKDGAREYLIGMKDNPAAAIVVTEDLSDDARLALIDLDVSGPELRGKTLRWDEATSAWRPFVVISDFVDDPYKYID